MKKFKFADDVDVVNNIYGDTPLHRLALRGNAEAISHPSFDVVMDIHGQTPRDYYNEYLTIYGDRK